MSRPHPERIPQYLGHILDCISQIETYIAGMDEAAFLNSRLTQDAVVRNFEIIGEASHRIMTSDPEFATTHPDFPLHLAYGMRNALAHGYDQVIVRTVWIAIVDHLPELKRVTTEINESIT